MDRDNGVPLRALALGLALAWALPSPGLRADMALADASAPGGLSPSGAVVWTSALGPVLPHPSPGVTPLPQAGPLSPSADQGAGGAPVPVSLSGASITGAATPPAAAAFSGPGSAGRAPSALAPLPGSGAVGAPYFSVGAAAAASGFGVRWRSSEKMLELKSGPKVRARLVLGQGLAVVRGRLLRLPEPLVLVDGAPALGRDGILSLMRALGARPPGRTPAPPAGASEEGPLSASAAAPPAVSTPVLAQPEPTAHAAARPLTAAGIRTIVVDAGHGGKDPGAHGPDGLREKDVCLDIALRLRRELRRRDPKLRVVLTRDGDYFVTLAGRTRIANEAKGDLFVSIHNNASPDPFTHGSQVFFFDSQSSDRADADLSLRENGEANQLDILMTDLAKSVVRDQSIGFASLVQRSLGSAINLKRRRVSYAPFYVLARTEMPAILVEVAFITNPHEEDLLGSSDFRQQVASSLATGVENYSNLVSAAR